MACGCPRLCPDDEPSTQVTTCAAWDLDAGMEQHDRDGTQRIGGERRRRPEGGALTAAARHAWKAKFCWGFACLTTLTRLDRPVPMMRLRRD